MSSTHRTDERFHYAWQKIRYGRRYSELFELAQDIEHLRSNFPQIKREGEFELRLSKSPIVQGTAMALLKAAVTSSKELREIAAALDAEKRKDPAQVNILRAYRACTDDPDEPPTLEDVRTAFKRCFKRDWGRSDYSVRKTLRMLGLPLAKARRGRPVGARSEIGNPRR